MALESEAEAEGKAKLLVEAEPLPIQFIQGYEGMKQRESTIPPQGASAIPGALDRLIALYTALEKPDEVGKYRELRSQFPAMDEVQKGDGK